MAAHRILQASEHGDSVLKEIRVGNVASSTQHTEQIRWLAERGCVVTLFQEKITKDVSSWMYLDMSQVGDTITSNSLGLGARGLLLTLGQDIV